MNSYAQSQISQDSESLSQDHDPQQMYQENQQQQLINRIQQQYLPQLRKQIHQQVYKQLQLHKKQLLADKTQEIKQMYTAKLQSDIQQINEGIRKELDELRDQVSRLKKQSKTIKDRKLSPQQQQQIVQMTIDQMISDPNTLQELKAKLQKKQEEIVLNQLEEELEKELSDYQQSIENQMRENRKQWEKERQRYWRQQSEQQLGKLAQEYRILEQKKSDIQKALLKKREERDELKSVYKDVIARNQEITLIKREIKALKS